MKDLRGPGKFREYLLVGGGYDVQARACKDMYTNVAGQALRMREGRLASFADVSANHGLGDILVLLLLDIELRASVGLSKKPHQH